MKKKNIKRVAWLLGSLAVMPFTTQAFDAGSDGSYGAINFSNNSPTQLTYTLVMPADGIFRCTAITIGTNCHVNFTPNALNTPVYLLAQSDIVINGIIDVSGSDGQTNGSYSLAGPGGFSGGLAGNASLKIPAGFGQGPGGGSAKGYYSGVGGSFGTAGIGWSMVYDGNTNTYGNLLLVPLIGGSGGAGYVNNISASGGAGGGAILLASSTSVTNNGTIVAKGGRGINCFGFAYSSGGGSGGAVRIVAPMVSMTGSIDVSGGTNTSYPSQNFGGNGRVRMDTPSTVNATVMGNSRAGSPVVSYGRSLLVFPPAAPQLYFTSVAGIAIQAGTNNSVLVPSGGSTNQIVTLCGTNFLGTVPVQIVATPANGPAFTTNIVLNFPTTNLLVSTNVVIQVPAGVATQLNAYANYGVQP